MSTLADRPQFGDIYTSRSSSTLVQSTRAVRVVGWTAKQAIVERVPTIISDRWTGPAEAGHSVGINTAWLAANPLPLKPVTKTGPYQRLQIYLRNRSRAGVAPADDDTVELHDPKPRHGQTFVRCDDPATFRDSNISYY